LGRVGMCGFFVLLFFLRKKEISRKSGGIEEGDKRTQYSVRN